MIGNTLTFTKTTSFDQGITKQQLKQIRTLKFKKQFCLVGRARLEIKVDIND